MLNYALLKETAKKYATLNYTHIIDELGKGTDGWVGQTNLRSVVKVFERERTYRIELACYQRLQNLGIRNVCGLAVPRLLGSSDELRAIEMELVSPPCLIDFGKAYLNSEPEHSPETLADHEETQREIWGDRYDDVQSLLASLRSLKIFYRDPTPSNIQFADWDQQS